jgi:hypothetical protein
MASVPTMSLSAESDIQFRSGTFAQPVASCEKVNLETQACR